MDDLFCDYISDVNKKQIKPSKKNGKQNDPRDSYGIVASTNIKNLIGEKSKDVLLDSGELCEKTEALIEQSVGSELIEQSVGSELIEQSVGSELIEQSVGSELIEQSVGSELIEQSVGSELIEQSVGSDMVSAGLLDGSDKLGLGSAKFEVSSILGTTLSESASESLYSTSSKMDIDLLHMDAMLVKRNKILQHDETMQQILAIARSQSSLSIIISGSKGIGKATIAKIIALQLIASDNYHKIDEIIAQIEVATHPSFKIVGNDIEDDEEIKIDEIRSLIEFTHKTSSLPTKRVIIVDNANTMNSNTQNAILKTLEEPNASLIIILVSHDDSKLLDTIKSRCMKFHLQSLTKENWKQLIQINYPKIESLDALAELSSQSAYISKDIIEHNGFNTYDKIIDMMLDRKLNYEELSKLMSLHGMVNLHRTTIYKMISVAANRIVFTKVGKMLPLITDHEREMLAKNTEHITLDKALENVQMIKKAINDIVDLKLNPLHSILIMFHAMKYNL